MKKRVLAMIMALGMVFSSAISVFARETDFFEENFTPVPAEVQVWGKVHTEEFDAIFDKFVAACDRKASAQEVVTLWNELEDCFDTIQTEAVFCEIDYYRDPQKYSEDYTAWDSAIREMSNNAIAAFQKASGNGYEKAFREALGDEECDALLETEVNTPEQLELLDKETALVNEYNILAGDAESIEELNAAVAPIMVELIKTRNEFARSKGYKNYTYFAYEEVYGRDYTPEEAKAFHNSVKEHIVPVEIVAMSASYSNSELAEENIGLDYLSEEEQIDIVEPWMDDVSDEYLNTYNYMKEYKLYDLEYVPTKLQVGFTVDLYKYNSAYIFNCPSQTYYDVVTLVHEFGHFANAVLSGEGASDCYDVLEIHSQGLEMLYMHYADQMVGEAGDAYRATSLRNMLSAVAEGALHDEFQQTIYAMENPTVQRLNETFKTISEEYGYTYAEGQTEAYSWVVINHTFASPFYYISYSTSALGALEILVLSSEDFEKGADIYLSLVAQQYVDGYCAAVEKAGLSNVFEEGSIERIGKDVLDYIYLDVCDITFMEEIKDHWANEWLVNAGVCGIFKGDEGGRVNPDNAMTVAEAITVIWRLMGKPEGEAHMNFDDVQPDDWYYDQINWFTEQLQYDDRFINASYKGKFGANDKITRATFVWMFYYLIREPVAQDNHLDNFIDGSEVPERAKDAMNWAIESGLITGRDDKTLDPGGYLTRAEIAKILFA